MARTWTVVADLYRLLRVEDALLATTRRRTTADRLVIADFFGRVCGLDLPDDEALVCVELSDSTASADQTFRQHMLRAPPEVRSPREAVAWSFELETHE